ncbi:hypothetical protein [Actinomycetospora aeridis]|uniref:YGGT family protein n=1 Tax=Actinomycetospora aeridis TaxID=3129231 RepID=A0ABU8N4I1_9PSEU
MTEQAGAQRTEGGAGAEGSTETGSGSGAAEETSSEATSGSESSASGSDATSNSESTTSESSGDSSGEAASSSATTTQTRARPAESAESSESSESSDQPPPSEAPTTQTRTPDVGGDSPRGREQRAPLDVGELVWKIAKVLASVVRVVAYVIAIVLFAYVLLTIVGVNPQNGVAQVIGGVADATVFAFRDLFLPADPTFAVIVNYGLAAVFWVLVAEFGSRIIRWAGARAS